MRMFSRIVGAWSRVRRVLSRRVTRREPTRRERGVALLLVIVTTAVLGATAADFAYTTQIELEAAVNSRDSLRAEYLAHSGLQLGQLLTVVQGSITGMLGMLPPEMRDLIVVTDYASFLAKAISGDAEAREGLGGIIGLDMKNVEGLGTPRGTSLDLTITSEEGKYLINCGGGVNSTPAAQRNLYLLLYNLVRPQRYDRLFNDADRDGLIATREDLPIGVIDWTDIDPLRYNPLGPSSGAEERYDRGKDRYDAHNHYLDTIEELTEVRGISENFWAAFGEMFTVYGSSDCKVLANAVDPSAWPLIAAMIAASAADKNAVFDPNTAMVARQVTGMLKTGLPMLKMMAQTKAIPKCAADTHSCPNQTGTQQTQQTANQKTPTPTTTTPTSSDSISLLSDLICSPMINNLPGMSDSLASMTGSAPIANKPTVALRPIPMCPGMLGQFLRDSSSTAGGGTGAKTAAAGSSSKGPRRFYRIDATGIIQRGANANKVTQTHIRGVWDTQRFVNNPLCTGHPSCYKGTWVYYRID